MQKLIAMGIMPGALIRLVQKFPSYVFEAGYTQFAVDEQIADSIYVRLVEEEAPITAGEVARPRRRWRRRGWFSHRR
jgi:DtxR family Mn-dependent transcriptional regulator